MTTHVILEENLTPFKDFLKIKTIKSHHVILKKENSVYDISSNFPVSTLIVR